MIIIGRILRTVALAILFAGSGAIVFAAIVLVKTAQAHGVPVAEAAANNAPIFIYFSKIAMAAAMALLLGESIDYAVRRKWTKLTVAQYSVSLLCVIATMVFAFGIVPPMERLLPVISTDESAHKIFQELHESSRLVFGAIIGLALVSLILPAFGALKSDDVSSESA